MEKQLQQNAIIHKGRTTKMYHQTDKIQEHLPERQQHVEVKSNKLKKPDIMQRTKRRRKNEQIKKTAPHPREKTTMKCNHTERWVNKEVLINK